MENVLVEPSELWLGDKLNMSVYDIGRVCVKTMGREAGYFCVVVDIIDKNYLLVDGLKVKRIQNLRRINAAYGENDSINGEADFDPVRNTPVH